MRRGTSVMGRILTVLLLLWGIAGCARMSDPGPSLTLSMTPFAEETFIDPQPLHPVLEAESDHGAAPSDSQVDPVSESAVEVAQKKQPAPAEQKPNKKKPAQEKEQFEKEDEFYDPFQTESERAQIEEYDPWEPFNVVMFEFNRKLDKYLIKPAATVYDKIMPDSLERGLQNLFHNMHFVPRLVNNLLQLKIKGAGLEVSRFLINTTLGVGGLFDFARDVFNLDTPDEDTGQTLGAYGIKPGPYLVLPLLPPLTVRDALGVVGDYVLDPINYLLFSLIRVGQPAVIDKYTTATFAYMGFRAGEIINLRSINLETFQGVEESTVDLYGAVRNAYLQRRAKQIRE